MAEERYDSRHTGQQIDDAVDAVQTKADTISFAGGVKKIPFSQLPWLALWKIEPQESCDSNHKLWYCTDGHLYYRENGSISADGKDYDMGTPAYVIYYCGNKVYRWNGNGFTQIGGGNVINDLTTGGVDDALSAEQGKTLKTMIDNIEVSSLGFGSYAEAWMQSQTNNGKWQWLMIDEVNNEQVRKPIWHVGNGVFIDAAGGVVTISGGGNAPSQPTFTQVGNKVTITPASGSILHYTINGGAEQTSTSAVEVTINQASMTIVAWCVNLNGSSSQVTQTYTASAPAAPVMTIGGNVVTQDMTIPRNSVVTITASEGDLYVKVGSGDYQKASGSSTTITCSGDTTTISAKTKDPQTSVESNPVTRTFSVAKPNAPQLSIESGDVISGTQLNVTWSGGTLHYIINNGTEQTESTSPLVITINADTDIEAWVVDSNQESSNHVTKSYRIAVPKLKVKVNGTTTMTLTRTDNTTFTPELTGEHEFTPAQLGINSFADPIKSIAFSPVANVVEFDGGGIILNGAYELFLNASSLTKAVGFVLSSSSNADSRSCFKGCTALQEVKLSGLTYWCTQMFNGVQADTIDISGLNIRQNGNFYSQMFYAVKVSLLIVGQGFSFPNTITQYPFGIYNSTQFITKVRVNSTQPPSLQGFDWVANLLNYYKMATIEVPSGSLQNYLDDENWVTYADKISEYND